MAVPAPHNPPLSDDGRPAVSVVVPFRDTAAQLEELLTALGRLRLAPSDEVIIADNTPEGIVVSRPLPPPVRAVRAVERRLSSTTLADQSQTDTDLDD